MCQLVKESQFLFFIAYGVRLLHERLTLHNIKEKKVKNSNRTS